MLTHFQFHKIVIHYIDIFCVLLLFPMACWE